jgi:hypothetical protein
MVAPFPDIQKRKVCVSWSPMGGVGRLCVAMWRRRSVAEEFWEARGSLSAQVRSVELACPRLPDRRYSLSEVSSE